MAISQHEVDIKSWPDGPALLKHEFEGGTPCPVSITFEKEPANVVLSANPEQPLGVNMAMNLNVKETVPVCIKLCEPICADSSYTIGIVIFDRRVATITIKGRTSLSNCKEEA